MNAGAFLEWFQRVAKWAAHGFAGRIGREYQAPILLVISLTLYCLLFVWQGIDVTDAGFHLSHQASILDGEPIGWPLNWVVDFIGGLLLWLVEPLGLLGARLIWVVVMVMSGLMAFLALRRVWPGRDSKTFISVAVAAVIAASTGLPLAHYYSLSALGSLIVVAGILWLMDPDRPSGDPKNHLMAFGLGFGLVFVTLMRLPDAIIGGLPVFFAALSIGGGGQNAVTLR